MCLTQAHREDLKVAVTGVIYRGISVCGSSLLCAWLVVPPMLHSLLLLVLCQIVASVPPDLELGLVSVLAWVYKIYQSWYHATKFQDYLHFCLILGGSWNPATMLGSCGKELGLRSPSLLAPSRQPGTVCLPHDIAFFTMGS